ncbi:hypothetical protein SSP24_56680 [Streptomyces spinoverrucosus]|uniref:Uncharacterized protein n=1 Tax=Streptomyces spinoverrucosus TaxID=284043 RepID=A0A4Y3VN68_9ACTN|nr:hypothetical protein SSP24_56680 [Streptomyces spinoverrucosus]GHB89171.1 hypothetical protein GCM10010397_71510 [Streptomyces spinoverrucosus]
MVKANKVWIFDRRCVIARHPRLPRPAPTRPAPPRRGARAGPCAGVFTKTYEAFCLAAKDRAGEREGTRMLIDVLLSHRR